MTIDDIIECPDVLFQCAMYERAIGDGDVIDSNFLRSRGRKGTSLLHTAAKYADHGSFKKIYEWGQFHKIPIIRDHGGNTPLHYAVVNNSIDRRTDMKKIVLSCSFMFAQKNNFGQTAAHCAARFSNPTALFLFFIRYSEHIYETDNFGSTPLHYAAIYGNANTLESMLKFMNGYKYITRKNVRGDHILSIAKQKKDINMVKIISKYCEK